MPFGKIDVGLCLSLPFVFFRNYSPGNGVISITCRNRHCPKCQDRVRDRWLARAAFFRVEGLPSHAECG